MVIKRQHWILGGGLGLAAGFWFMDGLAHTLVNVGEMAVTGGGLMLSLWWLRRQARASTASGQVSRLPDRQAVEQSIVKAQTMLDQLAEEGIASSEAQQALIRLQTQKNSLALAADRQDLQIAIVGGQGVGKTALAQALAHQPNFESTCQLQEIPSWFAPSFTDQIPTAPTTALEADVILFLTTGDLRESDLTALQSLRSQSPLFVLFNKQDQYLPGQQAVILEKLHQRLQGIVAPEHILPITAAPAPIKVRQQQPDGTWQEWQEQPAPALQQQLKILFATEEACQQLVWTTTHRTTQRLQKSTQGVLNQLRRDRALTLIEKYQWIAGGAAFINPVPSLDLLATVAINGQLILDLGKLYRQSFSLQQAQEVAATVAELVVKLGLVEVSTQALGAVLKTSGLTFWVGAGLQGVSAAYLTHMAGLSLVEYFEALDPLEASDSALSLDRLRLLVQKVFSAHQQSDLLKVFAQQAWEKLRFLNPQPAGATTGSV
jgi:GTPase SAR1 family protein